VTFVFFAISDEKGYYMGRMANPQPAYLLGLVMPLLLCGTPRTIAQTAHVPADKPAN
jgi:hypothetical protein